MNITQDMNNNMTRNTIMTTIRNSQRHLRSLLLLLLMTVGASGAWGATVTYHIINLGRLDNSGQLTSTRTEALRFTVTGESVTVGLPPKYKSPLAKTWKYYDSDDVTYDATTKECTFKSEATPTDGGEVLTEDADVYVTYELDEDAFSTVGLADGGIYNIKQGNNSLYQSMYQNVNNLNAYFKAFNGNDDPTIYYWKFNIVDPYQITIQTKSASYEDYYLAGVENNFNDIRLKSSLSIAQSTKVWAFGLLPGGTTGTYRLVVADGYVPTANIQTLDEFNHGYLNNADKARYQRYQGSQYKNCDLTFVPLKRTFTYHIIDCSKHHATQYTASNQAVGKLSDYTNIPEAIRSPYLEGEDMTFYTFTGGYSANKITDENMITEMPLTDADIYVTYTNTHLNDKFMKLRGARAFNIVVDGKSIYDDGSALASDANDYSPTVSTPNHLWYFKGNDPYAVQIENFSTEKFLVSTSSTPPDLDLSIAATATNNFILLEGSELGNGTTYEQLNLMAATGEGTTDYSKQEFRAYPVSSDVTYHLIDKAGKLIVSVQSSSSDLALPEEWQSPLVSEYHYYSTPGLSGDTYSPSGIVNSPFDVGSGGDIYVTYDVSDAIDLSGTKTYLMKFSDGITFHQEDGHDGINEAGHTTYGVTDATKAIYPYNNGDFNLYVYGQEQWESQLASGASTRTRWLWWIKSRHDGNDLTGNDADPYHVVIKSYQNHTVKDKSKVEGKENDDVNYGEGHSYLQTYKPSDYSSVITNIAYENEAYSTAYTDKMPTSMVNGQPTEYMILGTSLQNMTLKTFNEVEGERRVVNSFEQYWKNNPTVEGLVGANPAADNATLTARGWHRFTSWAYSAPWGGGSKTLAQGEHWFQTISMGSGNFTLEEVSLEPQVILLDQHGWEVMRVPLSDTETLRKYDSPMVETYYWNPTALKTTGYHKYHDLDPNIKIYKQNGTKWEWKDEEGYETYTFTSSTLAANPYVDHPEQPASVKTDFYVTYTVKSTYANAYTGAATADETIPTAYLLKQGGKYAITNGTTLNSTEDGPANSEDVPNYYQWYLRPNFDIDREMGYKYKGETGAQSEALTKSATDADNYSKGMNGFDPYNVQIQSKAQPLYYFTANTTTSALDGGAWVGSSTSVSLKNLNTKQTATGYDQTTLNITNATFMVVDDGEGNMRLMPRFDQQKVMQDFDTFEDQAATQPAGDNGTHAQSLYFERIVAPKEISSSADITEMDGHYILKEGFTFDSNFESLENFTGIIDGQLHTIHSKLTKPLIATATGAVIKNIILDNVTISGGTTVNVGGEDKVATGAIANVATGDTRIYNCGVLATNSTVATDDDGYTKITSCSSTVSGTDYVGGLVGYLDGSARVINCFSYADITAGSCVGGIVGRNNVVTTSSSRNTMVMNCMFYGDITTGENSDKAPIYNGEIITNVSTGTGNNNKGVGNYNYFRAEASYVQNQDIQTYNCALMAETRYLQRFEFFRHLLNSHRELAAWWATDNYNNKEEMAKWVMEPSQIGSATPYPILKNPGYYPSVVNLDADNAPTTTERNKGGKLGELTVYIQMDSPTDTSVPYHHPGTAENNDEAEITTSQLTLNITDKDPDHFNFNYYKVQLPYYNDVGTKNYTGNRVVTGWKIVEINGGTPGSLTTGADVTFKTDGSIDKMPYNYADRNCTAKDLYSSTNKRVFNQGAYWDVPEGVESITIEPYWGKAVYLADANADVVYNEEMGTSYSVPNVGGGKLYTDGVSKFNNTEQIIYTSIGNAIASSGEALFAGVTTTGHTVYDYAVVLVGNSHNNNSISADGAKPYTVTSIDLDGDNEPDYSYILRFDSRKAIHPVRYDFLNLVGLGMAQKSTGGKGSYNFGILQPKYWFEVTNTALFRVTQMEYDAVGGRAAAPIILHGGVIEQWVSCQGTESNKVTYFHVGGNVWFKEFHLGCHQDKSDKKTKHSPVSVTGGDYGAFYLTGLYATTTNYDDNAECYINGGRFGTVAGAGMEGIGHATNHTNGNIVWQIDHADIKEFYGGGINANPDKKIQGSITTIISNSHVDLFGGGPKFGDMYTGRKVTTTATDCTFGTYFGAGYGGNSYFRAAPYNFTWDTDNNFVIEGDADKGFNVDWNKWINGEIKSQDGNKVQNNGNYSNGVEYTGYHQDYIIQFEGVSARIDYQFLPNSNNKTNVARLFLDFVKFSLATTHSVTSTLTDCTITGNFYGGGSLGKVDGDVTSTLTDCKVHGNVFGAGYSAELPTVDVMKTGGFKKQPFYDKNLGVYLPGEFKDSDTFTWEQANTVNATSNAINTEEQILYTTENLNKSNLGSVAGNVTLTLDGNTTVGTLEKKTIDGEETEVLKEGTGNVFGGGESSYVTPTIVNNNPVANTGNTTVNLQGNTHVLGNVFGGGDNGEVQGSATVNIRPEAPQTQNGGQGQGQGGN